jgi:hypothetical protein
MYSGSLLYPSFYSISEVPSSLKFNTICDAIRYSNDALKYHTHSGGNDGMVLGSEALSDDSITEDKILDDNITVDKLAHNLDGVSIGFDSDKVDGYHVGNDSGKIPINNGTVNTNLNADKLDGKDIIDVKVDARTYNSEFVIEVRTSDPSTPATGRMWIRSDL